ncbi:WD40 repeat-like protein [Hortaea werneckii]|nr:WD40 repeat-like protein [Hortaea werneckii]
MAEHSATGGLLRNQNVRNVNATNGARVIITGGDIQSQLGAPDDQHLLDQLPYAEQAPFDSSTKQDDPLCLEDTRTEVRKKIRAWVYGGEDSCIFWLNGAAGTGKSTIARSIAHEFNKSKVLGASFFFVRGGGDVADAGLFFVSIARQLSTTRPALKGFIAEAVREQPDIACKSRQVQWTSLIVEPLQKWQAGGKPAVMVIVIDALDECDSDKDMAGLIAVLAQARVGPHIRLRIIVTSRPVTPIRLGFEDMSAILHRDLLLHDESRDVVDGDICLFFYNEFKPIKQVRRPLLDHWPGVDIVNHLVRMSEGLFIFAATVCRFVAGQRDAEEALELLSKHGSRAMTSSFQEQQPDPTKTLFLDKIYNQILERAAGEAGHRENVIAVWKTLGAVAALNEPLPASALAQLLSTRHSNIKAHLARLHSVVRVPVTGDAPIRLFHASFREFLFDPGRCMRTELRANSPNTHSQLFHACIEAMENWLKRNVCELQHPGMKVTKLERREIDRKVPQHVHYACRYWVEHYRQAKTNSDAVLVFLRRHLLHWWEAMSLMGRLTESVRALGELEGSIPVSPLPYYSDDVISADLPKLDNSELVDFVRDARRLIQFCQVGVEEAPLQVYESALVFAPNRSLLMEHFSSEAPKWIQRVTQVKERWDPCIRVWEGHCGEVDTVVFSPDGKKVASGSRDMTVRVWDVSKGSSVDTLGGHTDKVYAVAFSPDGQTAASASGDKTVRLWDVLKGLSVHKLIGHSDEVSALAFSPDGQTVASASWDKTVRLWDVSAGSSVRELVGHLDKVYAVAFSPDGQTVASASGDKTVRLWDMSAGSSVRELVGHSDKVYAVAFSPDGRMAASASGDKTVRLWDLFTGLSVRELVGHSDKVLAVAFSPNGDIVASASRDKTVRLWDVSTRPSVRRLWNASTGSGVRRLWDVLTGSSAHELVGHPDEVYAVTFSPDGTMVASASKDTMVRLWDVSKGLSLFKSADDSDRGHSDRVSAVAFSPDGKAVASASWDKTVRLWDVSTGSSVRKLVGHSDKVYAVAFSPDGQTVASASGDKTVRLWDVSAGSSVLRLLYDVLTGSSVRELAGHSDGVYAVAFSPDGQTVASASGDKTVRLWDVLTGSFVHELVGDSAWVSALTFSPRNDMVVALASGHMTGQMTVTLRLSNTN